MQRLLHLACELRSLVNQTGLRSRYADEAGGARDFESWVALCLALDTLEESSDALTWWQEHGLGSDPGERFLRFHGLLQSIRLQQDALERLHETLCGAPLAPPAASAWGRLRELHACLTGRLRQWTADGAGAVLTQATLAEQEVTIAQWDQAAWDAGAAAPRALHLLTLLADYQREAQEILEQLCRAAQAT